MSITPTSTGGRRMKGRTPFGDYDVDCDRSATGKRLRLVDEHGAEHGTATIDIRDMPPEQVEAIERASGRRRCRGCGDR